MELVYNILACKLKVVHVEDDTLIFSLSDIAEIHVIGNKTVAVITPVCICHMMGPCMNLSSLITLI